MVVGLSERPGAPVSEPKRQTPPLELLARQQLAELKAIREAAEETRATTVWIKGYITRLAVYGLVGDS